MSLKQIYQKEKQVVLYGQSLRFRVVKYSILIPLFLLLYFLKGSEFTLKVLLAAVVLSLLGHLFFRFKTKGWTRSWGLYRTK